ncbi:MAG: S24/S26 family peptidase [Paludibacteraceae bacterium]|nr:S24/S26 family peptidase [Paludibacteraceae bacterium]MBQ8705181.1 S24/S26 family peptidase [Paludibacteraceae bacterium]
MRIENDILIPELARLLAEGIEVRFTPSGVSMRPFIEGDKDSVVLSPLDSSPKKGDLLLAEANASDGQKKYVLHRLIDIEGAETSEPLYILMGDGNLSGKESCTRTGIIGRVTRIETSSGRTKPLTRGRLWLRLKPHRSFLLKLYRYTILKWLYS